MILARNTTLAAIQRNREKRLRRTETRSAVIEEAITGVERGKWVLNRLMNLSSQVIRTCFYSTNSY